MGTILYEAHYQFSIFNLIPVVMLILIILFPKIAEKTALQQGREIPQTAKRIVRMSCLCAAIFIGFVTLVLAVGGICEYNNTVGAYRHGQYEIVKGYVENFDPMPYEGRGHESFEINGVLFSYSNYEIQQGYHNAKSHGGVISGNGQYLKIGYVQPYALSKERNVIVYIEELSPPA